MDQARFFVTGTDTNIGKTVLSLYLMKYLYSIGETPLYIKPFQTGCNSKNDLDSDAAFIYRHVQELQHRDPSEAMIYCLKAPKAPFYAAQNEKKTLSINYVLDMIEQKSDTMQPLIIEGAGGVFVPLDKKTLMIDIIPDLKAKTILAARAGLGTINHTLLSIEALKSRGVETPTVVLIKQNQDPLSQEMINENIDAIESFSGIKPLGVIDYATSFDTSADLPFHMIETIINAKEA